MTNWIKIDFFRVIWFLNVSFLPILFIHFHNKIVTQENNNHSDNIKVVLRLWKTNKINIKLLWLPPNKSLQIKTVILHNALEHERKGDGNRKETNKHQIIKTRYKKNYVNINKNKYQKAVKEIKMRWCVFKLDFRLSLSIFLYVFWCCALTQIFKFLHNI